METLYIQVAIIGFIIIIGIAAYYFFNKVFFSVKAEPTQVGGNDSLKKAILPMKAQAYERMLLLIDRIQPQQIVMRHSTEGLNAMAYQHVLIKDLQAEYQHNVAQFLYLNPASVLVLRKLKADTIHLIHQKVLQVGDQASAFDLARELVLYMTDIKESPYEYATDFLQHDFQKDLIK